MLKDLRVQTHIHWNKGYRKAYTHYLGPEQKEYYEQLSECADIENIPDVLCAMHFDSVLTMEREPAEFRNYKYIIINSSSFRKEKE